jgi:hypothetical protein
MKNNTNLPNDFYEPVLNQTINVNTEIYFMNFLNIIEDDRI